MVRRFFKPELDRLLDGIERNAGKRQVVFAGTAIGIARVIGLEPKTAAIAAGLVLGVDVVCCGIEAILRKKYRRQLEELGIKRV